MKRNRYLLVRSALLFVYFFLIIAAHYHLKPASRSLFLDVAGSGQLPYVWIATALLLGMTISIYYRLVARHSRLNVVRGSVVIIVAMLLLFRQLLATPSELAVFAFYIFVDMVSVILVEQFWSLANAIHSEREGRRWYALIGTGGLLGGVAGGMGAHALITHLALQTLDLLLAAALILLLLIVLTMIMQRYGLYRERRRRGNSEKVGREFWRTIVGHRYLLLIASLLLLAQVIEPLVEYQFMTAVEAAFSEREQRTAYLGEFFSLLSGVAIGVNLLLTPLIHRWLGAIAGLAMQPLAITAGALFYISTPGLFAGSILKIADRGLSYSINRASKELLYIPVDPVLIFQAKAWIDMFGYRMFKVLGSVMILLLTQWLWFSLPAAVISWLTISVCALWALALIAISREYRRASRYGVKVTAGE